MKLFIDANIFLSFYHLTSEDLHELAKLVLLIDNKEISLLLPEQVIEETWRNRAAKITSGLRPFEKAKFSLDFPAYCKNYEQYREIRELQKKMEEAHSDLISAIQKDINDQKLSADSLIQKLFGIAKVIKRTPDIIDRARERVELGNPPGKKGSLGDAVNWESLLSSKPEKFTITIISDDSDFCSPLNTNDINEFLREEWKSKKIYSIKFYRKLSHYFKENYPDINLKTENEKDLLISKLSTSPNFSSTHNIISHLSKYDGFTRKQVEDIVNALIYNNQVRWIITDPDINEFYRNIYDNYFFNVLEHVDELEALLEGKNIQDLFEDDEIPF